MLIHITISMNVELIEVCSYQTLTQSTSCQILKVLLSKDHQSLISLDVPFPITTNLRAKNQK